MKNEVSVYIFLELWTDNSIYEIMYFVSFSVCDSHLQPFARSINISLRQVHYMSPFLFKLFVKHNPDYSIFLAHIIIALIIIDDKGRVTL